MSTGLELPATILSALVLIRPDTVVRREGNSVSDSLHAILVMCSRAASQSGVGR